MTTCLEDTTKKEEWQQEILAKDDLATKVFRFAFKDVFGRLLFVKRLDSISMKWSFCVVDGIDTAIYHKLIAKGDNFSPFYMYIELFEWATCAIGIHPYDSFNARKYRNPSKYNFFYRDFQAKALLETQIGNAMLHLLDKPYGNLEIAIEDYKGNSTPLFKASSIEELMVRMDIEANE